MDEKQFVDEALKSAIPTVIESLKDELKKSVTYEVRSAAEKVVVEYVTDWMKEHLLPEIGEMLATMSEPLRKSTKLLAEDFADTLAENLIAQMQKNMEDSWTRKKIFEALLD
jgi:uncharacterized protein with von Willebrand factor type A (vWA) domain